MDIQRKLASVRRIKEIRPIEGADKIVLAIVDGWQLVTQKSNDFKAGDLVIYFELDSFLPIQERFEFLRPSSYRKLPDGTEGFRIKTIKLRGQLSQGLILPMSEFFTQDEFGYWKCKVDDLIHFPEGTDLTEYLGVKKFELPIPAQLAGKMKGNFPSFIQKTDQERVQNLVKDLDFTRHDRYEVTLKLDGSSCTLYYYNGEVGVCSRNIDLIETEDNAFWKVARKEGYIDFLEKLGRNIAIQAELMGPGVQGNREGLKDLTLFVFDIFDIDKQEYLTPDARRPLIDCLEGARHVPIYPDVRLSHFKSVDDVLAFADSFQSLNKEIVAEGVVFKAIEPTTPIRSFKAISNKYLLGEK